jgi:polar amino acid transport system permease protein
MGARRCVPFLLFAYIIYYGLPSLGLRLGNWQAGLLALVLYHLAYMAELLRGAWAELPGEQVEAGRAFGFRGFGLLRRVILPPVAAAALPTLANQVVQIIKDSAFLTIIAVRELTHAATAIQATLFVPFASFVAAGPVLGAVPGRGGAGRRRRAAGGGVAVSAREEAWR